MSKDPFDYEPELEPEPEPEPDPPEEKSEHPSLLSEYAKQFETIHKMLDEIGVEITPNLVDRLVLYSRGWIKQVGESSQTRIGRESRAMIRAAGHPPSIKSKDTL